MSKYDALWQFVETSGSEQLVLSFDEIAQVAGVPLDHSFLRCKKELRGYVVQKISIKAQTVLFQKRKEESL